jgi:hypothetical protein
MSHPHFLAGVYMSDIPAFPRWREFVAGRCGTSLALQRQATPREHSEDDAMTPTRGGIENLVMRIQTAFLETPMLSLTLTEAQRRFGVDEVACAAVLGALVDAHVLIERGGTYRRHLPRAAALAA